MIAHSDWKIGEIFEGVAQNGNSITFDADSAHKHGPSPMEAVLMALCSCTSVDVVSILQKKRQQLTGLRVSAEATQAEAPPRVFTHIKLTYAVRGKLSRKAVEDAVSLSKNKYCSVSKMLQKAASIEYEIVYPDGEPEP
ncbi:OsmC family protein [Telmatobacter sp. DSM 110680]|uniref:OsmC family protein n=1 Tax=Telmatobacter sp. DSM 110680 TaxID=3036704 RepID=A0AAU7DNM8_9BACT